MNRHVSLVVILGIVVLACRSTSPSATPNVDAIFTAAAQTMLAPDQGAGATAPVPRIQAPSSSSGPTADPNRIEAGTYLVGSDIQPGLYRGQAGSDSCYWERSRNLAGSLDSILANDNAVGQFYVRVRDTDAALDTHCAMTRLASEPSPLVEMPGMLDPGTYLVGLEMQAGTYRGQAGSDSCYWARLSDVDGDSGSIIANDNASGQFYVQVDASDYALFTHCALQYAGP